MDKFMEFLVESITKLGGLFTGLISSVINGLVKMAFPNVDVTDTTNYTNEMSKSYFVKTFVGFAMIFSWILCYLLGGVVSKMFKRTRRKKRKNGSSKRWTTSKKRGYRKR